MGNFSTLKNEVVNHSEADGIEAFKEWILSYVERGKSHCSCGKAIKNICVIINNVNGNSLEVGMECIKYFDKSFAETAFKIIDKLKAQEKVEENREKHKSKVQELDKMIKEANEGDIEFLKSVKNFLLVNGKITPKQQEYVQKIKKRQQGGDEVQQEKIKIIDSLNARNDWERGFLDSIKRIVLMDYTISARQKEIFDKILQRNGTTYYNFMKVGHTPTVSFAQEDFDIKPHKWQLEAINEWFNAPKRRGIIEAATGTGKTLLGLMVVKKYLEEVPEAQIKIVVPTIVLQNQWAKSIEEHFGVLPNMVGGSNTNKSESQFTIAVVNSIRHRDFTGDLLIMDEVHRYGSDENISFLSYSLYNAVLGLSATVEREDGKHQYLTHKYPVIYRLSQEDSIKKGYIAPYEIINVPAKLGGQELAMYNEYQKTINRLFPLFNHDYQSVMSSLRMGDENAKTCIQAFNSRKSIINNSVYKLDKSIELIRKYQNSKIIVFNELKTMANRLYKNLTKMGFKAGIYHSGMKTSSKQQMLDDFANDKFNIMIAVKSLDEGLNVPAVDRGIIVAGNSTKRQAIQRIGRVLRKQEHKNGQIFQVYLEGTQDEKWMKNRISQLGGIPIKVERL